MLNESIAALEIEPEGVYVDATFGGGGHSKEILKYLGNSGRLIAIDQDKEALDNNISDRRLTLVHGNFRYLANYLKYLRISKVNGILADLGVSSHHFDSEKRGFSYRLSGRLDMRMNSVSGKDAASVLNTYSEADLIRIFRAYGEFQHARKLVEKIVVAREGKEIDNVDELVEMVHCIVPPNRQIKSLSQVFQALRIEVNDELEALKEFLLATTNLLQNNGRLVVISYHSLEDRLVKHFMRSGNISGYVEKNMYGVPQTPFEVISRKVIVPSELELIENSRAKPAKLRIAQKISDGREK
jgi:16S rRNA (cytosine1402-N4)-methyltransferase